MVISLLIRMQSAWYRNVLSQTAACKQHYNVRRKIPCNAHVDRRGLTYDVLDAIHIVYISLLSHIVCSCTWKKKKNANKRTQRDRLRSTQILIPFWLVPNNNNNNERFCSPVCHRVVVRILTLRSSFYWAYRFACCHGKTLQNKFRLTLALAILLQRPTP